MGSATARFGIGVGDDAERVAEARRAQVRPPDQELGNAAGAPRAQTAIHIVPEPSAGSGGPLEGIR
jgi:hypothetical protein